MIKNPGRPPTYMEARLLQEWLLPPNDGMQLVWKEEIIIHHITEDSFALGSSKRRVQLEVEKRHKNGTISFERIILE